MRKKLESMLKYMKDEGVTNTDDWVVSLLSSIAESLAIIADKMDNSENTDNDKEENEEMNYRFKVKVKNNDKDIDEIIMKYQDDFIPINFQEIPADDMVIITFEKID